MSQDRFILKGLPHKSQLNKLVLKDSHWYNWYVLMTRPGKKISTTEFLYMRRANLFLCEADPLNIVWHWHQLAFWSTIISKLKLLFYWFIYLIFYSFINIWAAKCQDICSILWTCSLTSTARLTSGWDLCSTGWEPISAVKMFSVTCVLPFCRGLPFRFPKRVPGS